MMNFFKKMAVLLAVLLVMAVVSPAAMAATNRELDTARLQDLMDVADRLQKENFTSESWQVLDDAMNEANAAMESQSQYAVDSAAGKMATALSHMVSMDFTVLNTALAAVDTWTGSKEEIDSLWDKLCSLIEQEQTSRVSGDQEAVNRLATEIDQTLSQLKAATGGTGSKTGSGPWIILFAVSLAFNAGLVVLMLLRTRNVKKCQKDDVPLVEYDIDDDIE